MLSIIGVYRTAGNFGEVFKLKFANTYWEPIRQI